MLLPKLTHARAKNHRLMCFYIVQPYTTVLINRRPMTQPLKLSKPPNPSNGCTGFGRSAVRVVRVTGNHARTIPAVDVMSELSDDFRDYGKPVNPITKLRTVHCRRSKLAGYREQVAETERSREGVECS